MKISVVDLNGKSIDLKVSSLSKFIDVKNMVEDFFDIEVNKQKFRVNDLMLKDEDDGKYLRDYNITNGSKIYIFRKLVGHMDNVFYIKYDNTTLTFDFDENLTIELLEDLIEKKTHIPVDQQNLFYYGVKLEKYNKMDDNLFQLLTLRDFFIKESDIIDLFAHIKLYVSVNDKIYLINVDIDTSIHDIKTLFHDFMTFNFIKLYHHQTELDNRFLLSDYSIKNRDILILKTS